MKGRSGQSDNRNLILHYDFGQATSLHGPKTVEESDLNISDKVEARSQDRPPLSEKLVNDSQSALDRQKAPTSAFIYSFLLVLSLGIVAWLVDNLLTRSAAVGIADDVEASVASREVAGLKALGFAVQAPNAPIRPAVDPLALASIGKSADVAPAFERPHLLAQPDNELSTVAVEAILPSMPSFPNATVLGPAQPGYQTQPYVVELDGLATLSQKPDPTVGIASLPSESVILMDQPPKVWSNPEITIDVRIFAPGENAAERLKSATGQVEQAGFDVTQTGTVSFGVSNSQVRYYSPAAREVAEKIATKIGGVARDFTDSSSASVPGLIEVWLSGRAIVTTPSSATAAGPYVAPTGQAKKPIVAGPIGFLNSLFAHRGSRHQPSESRNFDPSTAQLSSLATRVAGSPSGNSAGSRSSGLSSRSTSTSPSSNDSRSPSSNDSDGTRSSSTARSNNDPGSNSSSGSTAQSDNDVGSNSGGGKGDGKSKGKGGAKSGNSGKPGGKKK